MGQPLSACQGPTGSRWFDEFVPLLVEVPCQRVHAIEVAYEDCNALRADFLSQPPHGGLKVLVQKEMPIGELVRLRIQLAKEEVEEFIRGVVIWCRKTSTNVTVGVGFFSTEVEKRERLISLQERRDVRNEVKIRVIFLSGRAYVENYTKDLSAGGMFVKSTRQVEIGSRVLFCLYPPGQVKGLELEGKVMWRRFGEGFGVRFVGMADGTRRHLERIARSTRICDLAIEPGVVFLEVG